MNNLQKLLTQVSLFQDLNQSELERISKLIFLRNYTKGRTLFFENTPGEILYLINSGEVTISKKAGDGTEKILAKLGPGDFFGEMSLIDNSPRSATAKVSKDAELVVITRKAFQQMLETDPKITAKILMALLRVISARLRTANEKLKELAL
ncbi:MAG: cyclic nucleotide-binding domain-containing protein [Candidatus Edwardsbacteria bacterium]